MLTRKAEFGNARKTFEEAVDIRKKIGAPFGAFFAKEALFFVERHQYAREVSQNGSGTGNTDRSADLASAGDLLRQAERAARPEDVHEGLLLAYVNARMVLEQNPREAVERFEKLKTGSVFAGVGRYVFLASMCLGLGHERLSQWQEAERAFSEAVAYAEKIRGSLTPREKMTFLEGEHILGLKNRVAYDGLARVLEIQGKKPTTTPVPG
jgi:hypothetical protein